VFVGVADCFSGGYGNKFLDRAGDKRRFLVISPREGSGYVLGNAPILVPIVVNKKIYGKVHSIYDRFSSSPRYLR